MHPPGPGHDALRARNRELERVVAACTAALEAAHHEAQVEAALERVRARTMAMHRSDALAGVATVMFREFRALTDIETGTGSGCWISIMDPEHDVAENWGTDFEGLALQASFQLPQTEHPVLARNYAAWKRREPLIVTDLSREAFIAYTHYIAQLPAFEADPVIQEALAHPPDRYVQYEASFSHGVVGIGSVHPLAQQDTDILQRFAGVFDLAYRRFLDLQQAEVQAREAQVEAALERVRSRTMAMHKSQELADVIEQIYAEFQHLGFDAMASDLLVFDETGRGFDIWVSGSEGTEGPFRTPDLDHPHHFGTLEAWKRGDALRVTELTGELFTSYMQSVFDETTGLQSVPAEVKDDIFSLGRIIHTEAFTRHGGIRVASLERRTDEQLAIQQRFARVFEQTYTRFLDLQQAEARAREAVRDASLDRVRAEIASMRNAHDLQRITPLVWRELTTLGVPFFRCGVFIIDDHAGRIHAYLSTPQGASLAALHLPFDSAETTREAVAHWRRRQVYTDRWDWQQFLAWMGTMLDQGHTDEATTYQGLDAPPEQLALQFVPFTQGMLYVGSTAPLTHDQIALVQALADAFSVAYARYEDFTRLEAAKAEVEAALEHLKRTQAQLVQSEKMASLGQLTAGIAHEIKNPLNFVNNFAELTSELVEELNEALLSNTDRSVAALTGEVAEILGDLRINAEKINEHGRRADGIVRAMMQHARGGEGERRAVVINAFVEEYVNLAYHGMRASTPDFNVTIERAYDEAAGEAMLVPQEMGRVLINLLSNAFYAVHERAAAVDGAYAPTVAVSTRRIDGTVEIEVRDNGSGIAPAVRAKIFEPFFTTKPTGTGTGLGLSISYDIVTQGHGGALVCESTEGEGTTFVVTLPSP